MIAQVLVHKQRVERGRIEACEEHAHHDEQVHLLVLHLFCDVTIIALEAFAVNTKTCFEHGIVIVYRFGQKLFGTAVHGSGFKVLFSNIAHGILFLVGSERKDGGNLQFLVAVLL